jgi:hypothetical protein
LDRAILSIADISSLRVRVEVDERDVGAVHRPDGARQIGRARDVLEVIVDVLERDPSLVDGLRVTALFLTD